MAAYIAAQTVPGVFDGITPADAELVLDSIARLLRPANS